jgi:DNA processing protein
MNSSADSPEAEELDAWLRLALTPGVGPVATRRLLAKFGLPTAIFAAGATALAQAVDAPTARALSAAPSDDIQQALAASHVWLTANPRRFMLTLADADYPPLLLATPDPPPVLFAVGQRALLAAPALAIVGARSSTKQGETTAAAFAEHLAAAGLTIASGMALGIDATAHRGALKARAAGAAGSTIAVVGTGADIVYPKAHRALAEAIGEHGLLLSEFALGTPPLAHNFPRRNRILAGLARGVLVVEAALRSGSLITARLAADLGREVFAIPGSIHSPLARGCHRLIRDGAKLVESAQDVLEELRLDHRAVTAASPQPAHAVPPEHAALLEALGHDPVDLDSLCARTGGDTGALTAALFELELAQHVERLPGNRYQRLR